MTNEKVKEIRTLADEVFKERMEGMMKAVESKYTEVVKERATNDVHNQNFAVKQQYPEKCFLSFVLKNGEFVVPYEIGTIVTLTFLIGSESKVIHIDTKKQEELDIKQFLDFCKEYDYCIVKTVTSNEVELFDEDELDKSEVIKRIKNEWSQTFEGLVKCSDVVGCYKSVSKFTKLDDTQA